MGKRVKRAKRAESAGYIDCGCRDCFEIAIGHPGDFCLGCEEHGCEPGKECSQPSAYGCDEDSEDFLTPECGGAAGLDS